jgi:hypothetical protein
MKRRGCNGRPPISPRRRRKGFAGNASLRIRQWPLTRHGRPRVFHVRKVIGTFYITREVLEDLVARDYSSVLAEAVDRHLLTGKP